MQYRGVRAAVLGHVEWVDFLRVEALPRPGEIIRTLEAWEEPAGGGGVAAVELADQSGDCTLYSAFGDDDRGRRARAELVLLGVRVEAETRPVPQRRAITFTEDAGERTITVIGERIAARADDPLDWPRFASTDAVYICAGDPAAIRLARRARIVVATARILPVLREAAIELDALVASAADPAERYAEGDLDPPPRMVVRTMGAKGGELRLAGATLAHYDPAPLPGPVIDAYGAGDSFAAGLACALAAGKTGLDAAAYASRRGALALTRRGAFGGRLDGLRKR